jgi:hypothetical protein
MSTSPSTTRCSQTRCSRGSRRPRGPRALSTTSQARPIPIPAGPASCRSPSSTTRAWSYSTRRQTRSGRASRPPRFRRSAYLDRNQGQLKNATFTLSGYGVDIGEKKAQIVVGERRMTTSYLKNVQNEVVVFQINDQDSKAGGGSCFGESGGPVFVNGFVLGDSSYVNSFSCNATAGYQRTDTAYSRNFLNRFLNP